jgi:hypothetical protein
MVDSLLLQIKSRPQSKAARGSIRGKSEIRNKTNAFRKRARRKERVSWNNDLNGRLSGLPSGARLLYPPADARTMHGCHGDGLLRDPSRRLCHSFRPLL